MNGLRLGLRLDVGKYWARDGLKILVDFLQIFLIAGST